MKRIGFFSFLLLTLHTPTYAAGTIAWDAEAGINQYQFEDSFNGRNLIDNSAIQAEVGASFAFDKFISRLSLSFGSSIGDAEFTHNSLKGILLYPINNFTLLGGYELRQMAISKFGNGLKNDIDISSGGLLLGASYRIAKTPFVASLTVAPLDADIENNTINRSTSESTTATIARLSYSHKTYKFSLAYASYEYDSVAESIMQVKVLRPF